MPTNRKKQMAYHEAGHAVIARMLGVGVPQLTLVSVDADNAAGAITASAAALADRNDLFAYVAGIEKDIKISIAGPQSQNIYRPSDTSENHDEWESDRQMQLSLALKIVLLKAGIDIPDAGLQASVNSDQLDEAKRLLARLAEETRALVIANWPAITRVAEALLRLRRQTLDQAAIDALIATAGALR